MQTASTKETVMSFRSLLGRLMPGRRSNRRGRATPRPGTCRPGVESLEDRRTPSAMLTIGDVTVVEGNDGAQNARVTVSLTEPHGNSVTVNYRTADGTAVAGSDYTAVSGKLTFAKNEMSKSILVPIKGDRLVEDYEYFSVQLSNPKGAKIADGTGLVTIADNEPYVYITYAYATEGNDGTSPADFTVSLTGTYDLPVTVNYATADGSATAGADYTAASGALTFAPGETSKTLSVAVLGDRLGEPDESFVVNVSTPDSYARIGNAVGVATIVDNEPHISIADSYLNGTTITFTVTLSTAYGEVVTANFATVDGTAIAGVDYVAASGPLTFAAGETSKAITIDVLDPTSVSDKYFLVQLSGATANAFVATGSAYGYWYYDPGYYDCGC
jgi:large repetitive protein